jgi:adenosylmethionine-8-amino-7-oxononanoate aminotransferase
MCGAGRCGTWRALEHDGVTPDIMAVAKGLGAGYLPLGATIYHRRVAETIDRHDGGPLTGHTFTGHTTACAAGVAVQRIVKRDGLVARVRRDGPAFLARIGEALEGIDSVGDIRGRGFFVGVELVADRASKTPFEPALHVATRIGQAAAANGLLCYPSSGNIDGVNGDTVILAPPYITSDAELDEIAGRFGESVRQALAGLPRR